MVEQVKNKKSHSGHGLRIKTGDMLGLRLLNKKHIYLTNVILVSKYISHFSNLEFQIY